MDVSGHPHTMTALGPGITASGIH